MKKILFVVLALVLAVGGYQTLRMKGEIASRYSKERLQEIADEVNKGAPVMADELTRLDRASADEGRFTYHYTVVSYAKAELDVDAVYQQLYSALSRSSCADADFQPMFMSGVDLRYAYNDKNGVPVTEVIINSGVCAKEAPARP